MKQTSTNLTPRTKTLVSFAARLSLQKRKSAYTLMRRQLDGGGLEPEFFAEVLLHLSLFLGYPPLLEGLEVLSRHAKRRIETPSLTASRRSLSAKGKRLFAGIYGNQTSRVLRNLERLHPGLAAHIVGEPYGRFMSRGRIDLCEREILNVVVLFLLGYQKQLFSHLRGAMRVGVSLPVLTGVLEHAGTLGRRSAKRVIRLLDHIGRSGAALPF